MPNCRRLLLTAALLAGCLLPAGRLMAKTTMDVQVGWEGTIRFGRWTPVMVTLSDPDGRDVVVELSSGQDAAYGMSVRQHVGTLASRPKTFPLYVPVLSYYGGYSAGPVHVRVRDAKTRKVLARTDPDAPPVMGYENVAPGQHFIGVSGYRTGLQEAKNAMQGAGLRSGFLPLEALPRSAVGYDALDVLLLNAPDLSVLDDEQQQAIVDWVAAGGSLLLWPGDFPVPDRGPLIDALPAEIGLMDVVELSPEQEDAAGVQLRDTQQDGRLTTRRLNPKPDAAAVPLLGLQNVAAYHRPLGLGTIVVVPVDLPRLRFRQPDRAAAAWRPVLRPMIGKAADRPAATPAMAYGYGDPQEGAGEVQIADVLGNVPGAGRFGFSYVAVVLIGLMLVVGPVDWFVLRLMKRQAWTWVTTSGWIGLVTVGAIYAGHLTKSGDLHFRTFSVVDQAGGRSVATRDYVGIYAPRSSEYDIKAAPSSWWEPMAPGMTYGRPGGGPEVDFRQTYQGTTPDPMFINVWSLRFLKSERLAQGDPLIEATLSLRPGGDDGQPPARVIGTIKNLSDKPLRDIRVRVNLGLGSAAAVELPPGGSTAVDMPLTPPLPAQQEYANGYVYGPYGYTHEPYRPEDIWGTTHRLTAGRTLRARRLLGEDTDPPVTVGIPGAPIATPEPAGPPPPPAPIVAGRFAWVLAEQVNPEPPAALKNRQPIEQHRRLIRAVVPLEPGE